MVILMIISQILKLMYTLEKQTYERIEDGISS